MSFTEKQLKKDIVASLGDLNFADYVKTEQGKPWKLANGNELPLNIGPGMIKEVAGVFGGNVMDVVTSGGAFGFGENVGSICFLNLSKKVVSSCRSSIKMLRLQHCQSLFFMLSCGMTNIQIFLHPSPRRTPAISAQVSFRVMLSCS